MNISSHKRGIALLITLLVMSVLLAISAFLLNVTLKQFQFSGIGRDSEMAFQAAEAGIECAMYTDKSDEFDVPDGSVAPPGNTQGALSQMDCFNVGLTPEVATVASGGEQRFKFDWGAAGTHLCTDISVYKFYNTVGDEDMTAVLNAAVAQTCPAGYECTVVKSRGYNTTCADILSSKTVEREITQRF